MRNYLDSQCVLIETKKKRLRSHPRIFLGRCRFISKCKVKVIVPVLPSYTLIYTSENMCNSINVWKF